MATRAETILNICKSLVITGELSVDEDLLIEGRVEGIIQLRNHVLTIGPNGRVNAKVFAKSVIVLGEVTGTMTATDKIDIRDHGSVDGDVISPRVRIAEGAHFHGFVEMPRPPRSNARSHDGTNPSVWYTPNNRPVEMDLPRAESITTPDGPSTIAIPVS